MEHHFPSPQKKPTRKMPIFNDDDDDGLWCWLIVRQKHKNVVNWLPDEEEKERQ